MSGKLTIIVEMIGRSPDSHRGRVYTVGPCHRSQYYSPLIGKIVGTRGPEQSAGEYTVKNVRGRIATLVDNVRS